MYKTWSAGKSSPMVDRIIGRLKHSTSKKCPECGKVLQVRVRSVYGFFNGLPVDTPEEYIGCSNPNCWYELEVEQKRRKLEEKDITIKKPKRDFGKNLR